MTRAEKEVEKTEKSQPGEGKQITPGDVGKAEAAQMFKHMMPDETKSTGKHEHKGNLDVTVDAKGHPTEVKTAQGTVYHKEADDDC